jgi:hypothetical protein
LVVSTVRFLDSIETCAGLRRKRFVRSAMRGGMVAEKKASWRSSGSSARMVSMSSRKPRASISSASSSTQKVTCWRVSDPRRRWSSRRPGVPTTIWAPARRARNCRSMGWPP